MAAVIIGTESSAGASYARIVLRRLKSVLSNGGTNLTVNASVLAIKVISATKTKSSMRELVDVIVNEWMHVGKT